MKVCARIHAAAGAVMLPNTRVIVCGRPNAAQRVDGWHWQHDGPKSLDGSATLVYQPLRVPVTLIVIHTLSVCVTSGILF